ncbi:MAG: hypothetical protein ABIA37_00725 [Candidatus Woesearchaeota archaeon]
MKGKKGSSKPNPLVDALAFIITAINKNKKIIAVIALLTVSAFFAVNYFSGVKSQVRVCSYDLTECQSVKRGLTDQNMLLQSEKNNLTSQVSLTGSKLGDYEDNLETRDSQLSKCQKDTDLLEEQLKTETEACTEDLDNKTEALKVLALNHTTLLNDYSFLTKNYAKYKCCPQYSFYAVISNNVLCCYESGSDFICGAGIETPREEINDVWCS